ncbi:hypothetical protein RW71_04462 [Escherichia coli]|uniref:hypothetical protein n=1 Tax=Escherichia coli TaxID=562 RepID=UPI000B9F34A6|nr:hypothetical protein [Escherichia coli]OXZ49433.1 hypothetical protein RW71_04462 [Escherichia coli]OXZ81358.1 hypothetical protein RW72_04506 [Escherichia coli]
MADVQFTLPQFLRMFVVVTVIVVGYGYLLISAVTRRKLGYILQILSLGGVSALFSFIIFRSEDMWSGAPEVPLALLLGTFTATVLFFMFALLFRAFLGGIAQRR